MRILRIALAALFLACFPSCSEKQAPNTSVEKTLSRWSCAPKTEFGTPYGLILKSVGGEVVVEFHELKDAKTFQPVKLIGSGFLSAKNEQIYVALGVPAFSTPQDWVESGGPHWTFSGDMEGGAITGKLSTGGAAYVFERVVQ